MTILREKNTCTKKNPKQNLLTNLCNNNNKKKCMNKNPRRQTSKLVNYNMIDRKKIEY